MARLECRFLLWLTLGFSLLQVMLFTPFSLVGFYFLGWAWLQLFRSYRLMKSLKVQRAFVRTRLFIHEQVIVRVDIHHSRPIAIPMQMRVSSTIPTLANKAFQIEGTESSHVSIETQAVFYTRGLKHIGPLNLLHEHPLGLFRIYRTIDIPQEVIVFPRLEKVFFQKEVLREIMYGRKTAYPMLEDASRLSHLQEYDHQPFHRIHWKLSARMDLLMAKEFEKTSTGNVVLLVDLNLPDDIVINQVWQHMRVAYEDTAINAAGSLIQDLKVFSTPVRLVIIGEKIWESRYPRKEFVPYLEDLTRAWGCEKPEISMVRFLRERMMSTTVNDTVVILCMHISSSEVPLLMKLRARSAKVIVLIMPYGYRSSSALPSRSYGMPHPDLREMLQQAHILMENGVTVRFFQENDALQEAIDLVQ